jgi:hypothetical protein
LQRADREVTAGLEFSLTHRVRVQGGYEAWLRQGGMAEVGGIDRESVLKQRGVVR